MEYKGPMSEPLGSLEWIVFKDVSQTVTLPQRANPLIEFEQLRRGTGLKIDDFTRVMSMTVAMVHEWESRHVKPSTTELKLMRSIRANLRLSKQLMD